MESTNSLANALTKAKEERWSGFGDVPEKVTDDVIVRCYMKQLLSRWGGLSGQQISNLTDKYVTELLTTKELLRNPPSELIKNGKLIGKKALLYKFIADTES